MKNKFALIAFALSLLTTSAAMADEHRGDDFAKHKAEMITNLNQDKGVLDSEIYCVNSAQKREDLEKCHEQKKAAMEKLEQQRLASRKAHLENEIKKIDSKMDNRAGQQRSTTGSTATGTAK